MINWKLLKNPLNWIIVGLMLVIASIGGHLVLSYFGKEPSTSDSSDAQ